MKRLYGFLLGTLAWTAPALALDVRDVVWGFDGRVVPEHFNVVSVLVANPSADPFDGTLRLSKSQGLDKGIGAAYAHSCYVSPFGSRWVQFYPYVTHESHWRLEWGRSAADATDLKPPEIGAPAQVALSDPDAPRAPRAGFRRFPDPLFPPTVAATDGLADLLLDYAPRWEPAKRTALLDWLRRGGAVHVLRGPDGRYPVFGEDLAVLNTDTNRTRVGAGWVVRHPQALAEMSARALADAGFPAPRLEQSQQASIWQFADAIFPAMTGLAQPRHRWWLIDILTVVYILLVGPGVYVLARRSRGYRLALSALVGCVVCFGGLFAFVGRRGQGETGAVHSLAYARPLGEGAYEVTQWIDAFVTRGAYYTLTHAAPHNLYAVPQDYESVNGVIEGGKDGRFAVDMPIYSQRTFMHQGRCAAPSLDVGVRAWPGAAGIVSADIEVGDRFPRSPLAVWALWRGTVWPMHLQERRLVAEPGAGRLLEDFFAAENVSQYNAMDMTGNGPPQARDTFLRLAPCIMAWAVGGTKRSRNYVPYDGPRDDRIRLFVLADSPDAFRLRGTPIGPETGCVIYDVDLLPPEARKDGHDLQP